MATALEQQDATTHLYRAVQESAKKLTSHLGAKVGANPGAILNIFNVWPAISVHQFPLFRDTTLPPAADLISRAASGY
jgi:hypothetical protein